MKLLEKRLGRSMMTTEVAEYFDVKDETVRRYYKKLGGMRLGSRYVFFEKGIVNAVSKEWKMEGPSEEKWKEEGENILHEERGHCLGKQNASGGKRMGGSDKHNLLA